MSLHDPQATKNSPEEDAAAKRLAEDMEAFNRFIDCRWERRYGGLIASTFTKAITTWERR